MYTSVERKLLNIIKLICILFWTGIIYPLSVVRVWNIHKQPYRLSTVDYRKKTRIVLFWSKSVWSVWSVNSAFAIEMELGKSMCDVCDVCVKFIEKLRTKFNIEQHNRLRHLLSG